MDEMAATKKVVGTMLYGTGQILTKYSLLVLAVECAKSRALADVSEGNLLSFQAAFSGIIAATCIHLAFKYQKARLALQEPARQEARTFVVGVEAGVIATLIIYLTIRV